MQLGPHHLFEGLSLMCAIFMYGRLKNSFMVGFIPFLALVFGAELYSNYLYYSYQRPTVWIFNILTGIILLFYGFIFHQMSQVEGQRRFIVVVSLLYVISWIVYYLIAKDVTVFNNYFFALGSFIQVVFACQFFYNYLGNDDPEYHQAYKSGVWIAAGVLIFNCGIAIVFAMYDYIREHQLKLGGMVLYNFFPRYLSILLYSCIAVSFFAWRRRTPT